MFNGLLLAPHLDAAFDGGWISFAADGSIAFSEALSHAARAQLALDGGQRADGLKPGHQNYLAYHREKVFRHSETLDSITEPPAS